MAPAVQAYTQQDIAGSRPPFVHNECPQKIAFFRLFERWFIVRNRRQPYCDGVTTGHTHRAMLLLATTLIAATCVHAADFMKGIEAFRRGDYEAAYAEWLPMAQGGDLSAMYNIALIHDQGLGRPADKLLALRWYSLPAEEGDISAQFNMATIYHFGDGVVVNKPEAARWYQAAAELADEEAQYNLGLMRAKGDGIEPDVEEAIRWYRLSADQGHVGAQFRLGHHYDTGDGVEEDNAEAMRWYLLAANQGNSVAQNNLGAMYFSGEAAVFDWIQAYKWFYIAEQLGNNESRMNRQSSGKLMSGADIAEAQKQAEDWLEKFPLNR